MKKKITIFIFIVSSNVVLASNNDINSLLRLLDKTIENKEYYVEKKQNEIDSFKVKLSQPNNLEDKFYLAQQICFAYSAFMKDSSLVFAIKMSKFVNKEGNLEHIIESKINYISILGSMGFFKEANAMISNINPSTLTPKIRAEYILAQITIHNHQEKFASNSTDRDKNSLIAQAYRDSLLTYNNVDANIKSFLIVASLLYHKQYDSTIVFLNKKLKDYKPYSRDAGILDYSMALAFQKKKDNDNAIKYFIMSSIADIQNGVRANTSLRILAKLMFEKGDINRAYSYMNSAWEDAILCNARINTIEASDMYVIIDKAFQKKEKERFVIISVLSFSLLAVCLILMFLFFLIKKKNIKIEKINSSLSYHLSEIEKINSELFDSSKIKEQYVGLYMEQYKTYLSKISSFKRRAYRIAQEGNKDTIVSFLNSTLNTEEELAEFYNNFDKTILNLFPNFVNDFNALLTPENEIIPTQEKLLTPELRIFALVRLGITDSIKISHFLQYSQSTIYNYRTKMRNKAKGNRDDFEINVVKIGQKML